MAKVIIGTAEDGTEYAWGPFYTFNSFHRARNQLLADVTKWTEDDLRELTLHRISPPRRVKVKKDR